MQRNRLTPGESRTESAAGVISYGEGFLTKMMRIIIPYLWLVFVLLSGCAGPAIRPGTVGFLDRAEDLSKMPATDRMYRLQIGDEITVKFFYNKDLNEELIVRPDGKISLQLINDIDAAGKLPEHLAWEIMARYKKVLNTPEVTVIVKRSAGLRAFIGGDVRQAGVITMDAPTTVLQAVFQVGGFLDTASTEDIILIRRGEEGRPQVYRLNLSEPLNDIFLSPFDIVFVPKSGIAAANLFIEQYIDRMLPFSRSVGFSYANQLYFK